VKAFVLAAEGASGVQPGTTPPAYVRQMFDQYAERFDAHLLGELEYRGHIDVVDLVSRLKDGNLRVLDLGCGTGLVGAELQRVPGSHRIHGVDIAPQMLERASARRIYTALHCTDILEFLGGTTPSFDAITAADVLIYLGEAKPLFIRVRETLNCDGVFVFTIERNDDDLGVKLTPSRRYRHGEAYVRRCADNAGLAVLACEPIVIRHELQGAVDGFVVALTVS
jgi:predicted TPR repeat methyltransferase